MARAALIGHTGFVGSNLARQFAFDATYNSRNIEAIAGERFEELVFSGAQAKKWWANQNPEEDWAGIERALAALETVEAEKVTLISTIDVAVPGAGLDEAADYSSGQPHAYGVNRRRLEDAFRERFPGCLIVRLPGLFGRGLKKNVIYDLLEGNMLEKINPESRFQYYDLERLKNDLTLARGAALTLAHLVTEPVATSEIIARFFPEAAVGADAAPFGEYDFRTLHADVFGGAGEYIEMKESVLDRMGAFIERWRAGEKE